MLKNSTTAYVIGVAIGDGNLSNPNGRATRLRVTCDDKYPNIKQRIIKALTKTFLNNKVSEYKRINCTDVYCHSNKLENILGWKAYGGPKYIQNVTIPRWIIDRKSHIRACLRGLFETDGSVYLDRGYTYVNFTTIIQQLAHDTMEIIAILGYKPRLQSHFRKAEKLNT